MTETADARAKRQLMRSWRRGTKEMDLILGPWAEAHLAALTPADVVLYDQLLDENDQDLMQWVLGQTTAPAAIAPLIATIAAYASTRLTR